MKEIEKAPIGLQLFSVRAEVAKDLPGTLAQIAALGYRAAEPWGYQGDKLEWQGYGPEELRQLFDEQGLTCCGMHLATGALLGDNLERTIELNQALGNRYLIIAADKARMSSKDTVLELAEILDSTAEKLRPLGMFTGYHAHGFDFVRFGELTAWEMLFDRTREEVVMQIDIANCANGGGDPVAMLRKYPGRARSVHLREYGDREDLVIGEGKADWPTIFDLCDRLHHPEYYVVEEGGQGGAGFDVPRRSLEALRKMGRV